MWYNKIMVWLLRSPLHSMISSGIMIIGFSGSKSGKSYSTPVNYYKIDETIYAISDRSRTWWKNIKKNPDLDLFIKRENFSGKGIIIDSKVQVEDALAIIYKKNPQIAKYMKVEMVEGEPVLKDIQKLSDNTIVIKITLIA